MMSEVFLDTVYAVALSVADDAFHSQATRLVHQLKAGKTRLITTQAVLLEIGDALSKLRYRQGAVRLLQTLAVDPTVEIVPLSEQLYAQAYELYSSRPDKEWGLTDCVSFVVMQERGITEALTTDVHFQQAGFRALLREDSP